MLQTFMQLNKIFSQSQAQESMAARQRQIYFRGKGTVQRRQRRYRRIRQMDKNGRNGTVIEKWKAENGWRKKRE